MLGYIARRSIYTLGVLFVASIIIFYGLRVAPSSPENTLFLPYASPAAKHALRQRLGLDRPVIVQYVHFVRDFFSGNLGESIKSGQPIPELIRAYGKNSLLLIACSALLSYAIAIPLGVLAAVRRGSWVDRLVQLFAGLALGVPNFLFGLILLLVLGSSLRWLPVGGTGGIRHLILPTIALSAEAIAVIVRLMRSAMLEQLELDYVRALRAKGLRRSTVIWRHVLRNALIPIISLSGVQLGALVGYTAIIEIVFRWPGLGQLLVTSVLQRDYPVALWLSLVMTFAVILANFAANIGYALVDPRIRLRSQGAS